VIRTATATTRIHPKTQSTSCPVEQRRSREAAARKARRLSRSLRGPAPRGLPNPRILWRGVILSQNVARIWQSEPRHHAKSQRASKDCSQPEDAVRCKASLRLRLRLFRLLALVGVKKAQRWASCVCASASVGLYRVGHHSQQHRCAHQRAGADVDGGVDYCRDLSESQVGGSLTGSRPIVLAVLRRITPNAVGLLPISERTLVL